MPGRLVSLVERPPSTPNPIDEREDALAADVERSPRANAYLSLEPGLTTYRAGGGVLTWASLGRTAFAVGGVHGPRSPTELLLGFRRHLEQQGYGKALLFPVSLDERDAVEAAGFRTLMVGSEAFVDPRAFTLSGGRMADLRQMFNRGTRRFGLRTEEVRDSTGQARVLDVYERWLAARPEGHRLRLLIGTPCLEDPHGRRYFVARDEERVHAAVSLTPGWSGRGYGVDVMARAPDAAPGAMEVALVEALRALGREGVERLSLGACPMHEALSPPEGDPRALRAVLRWIYRSSITQRLFHFQALPRFKAKFEPCWEPSFIAAWPRVGVRSLYSGCRMWGLFGPAWRGD